MVSRVPRSSDGTLGPNNRRGPQLNTARVTEGILIALISGGLAGVLATWGTQQTIKTRLDGYEQTISRLTSTVEQLSTYNATVSRLSVIMDRVDERMRQVELELARYEAGSAQIRKKLDASFDLQGAS
jgi:hypothetical protein